MILLSMGSLMVQAAASQIRFAFCDASNLIIRAEPGFFKMLYGSQTVDNLPGFPFTSPGEVYQR